MKVLFVGEGPNDVGSSANDGEPRPAGGVVPALARKVLSKIGAHSLTLRWTQLHRFYPGGNKGLAGKVAAAILQAARKFECVGTVCVYDRDRDRNRLRDLEEGAARGIAAIGIPHNVVCGVAVESIEAWTLGAPEAIAAVLEADTADVSRLYPHPRVEELFERSGKPEHQPKALLDRIVSLADRRDSTELRVAIADKTDIAALEKRCQEGFKPFAEKLRAGFGTGACPDGCGLADCREANAP